MLCYLEVVSFGAAALVDHPSGIVAVIAVVAMVIGALAAGIVVYQPRWWIHRLLLGLQGLLAIVVLYRGFDNPVRLLLLVLPAATVAVLATAPSRRYYASAATHLGA